MQHHVAGHLEQEVTEEEHACAQAVHGFGKLQVGQHLQLGKAHVDTVEVSDDVAQHEERDDAPGHLAVDGVVDGFLACGGAGRLPGQCL
ncbi:hypothetical protein D3C81_2106760 [compost metagenome]